MSSAPINFRRLLEPVVRRVLGEPNAALSDRDTLRWGTNGSLKVEIAGDDAGTWFDHEIKQGGGVLDFLRERTGLVNGEALDWIRENIDPEMPGSQAPFGIPKTRPTGSEAKAIPMAGMQAKPRPALGPVVATYDYLDQHGQPRFQVRRHEPKTFTQAAADGKGSWVSKKGCMGGVERVPFRLPELLAAPPDTMIFVAEGEKDVLNLAAIGLVATCNPGGAGDWKPEYSEWLRGRDVTILPDADPQTRNDVTGELRFHKDGRPIFPGADHAADVAAKLQGVARSVRILKLPGLPEKGDVSDWLAVGGTAAQLLSLVEQVAPEAPATMDAPSATPGDALRADVDQAAEMSRADYLTVRRAMAAQHRIPVGELDALRAEARREAAGLAAAEAGPKDAPGDTRGRADLQVVSADLPDTAAELAEALAKASHLFDRGGPARISRDRSRDAFVVETLNVNSVVTEAHRIARPWMWVKNRDGGTERRDITLPERVAKLYLDHRDGWGLRPLDGITSAPLLHTDGTVRAVDGYDPDTRLWCERVPALNLPAAPTKGDAVAALLRLRRHFRTFAFTDAQRVEDGAAPVPVVDTAKPPGADESAFLAVLLTAVCRPCLWLAPGLLIRAPEYSGSGTGKGLLVRAICAVAFGSRPEAITAGATPEEMDKRITAALMGAGATMFLDNVNGAALKSDVLASAITERPAAVRPLGRSATVQLNPTAFVAVTGNGLLLSEDMARRFVTVELDAGVEDPEARDFRADFLADTLAARETLLRDVLVIWRWGRQCGDNLPAGRAMGSFTQWGRWCRDPLLALGCVDPALRIAQVKAKDPRRQKIAEVFAAWWEAHGATPVPVSDLAETVKQAADPKGIGRQYLAAAVRALDGTRAAGFVLSRIPTAGRWSPDRYSLGQTQGASVAGAEWIETL